MNCSYIPDLKDCAVSHSYLRPDTGFTVIPWLYALIILSLHFPLVFIRILKWETGQWLTILMALFSIGLLIIEYSSTHLDASQIYVWTPIVVGIDIGACFQVWVLVLEKHGERLPGWKSFMRKVHWKKNLDIFHQEIEIKTTEETGVSTPTIQATTLMTPATLSPSNARPFHFLLGMSLFCFVTLVVLQFVGLVYTAIGLNLALHEPMKESWCSPSFQVGLYLFDDSCRNYSIAIHPERGIGCVTVDGTQPNILKATMTILIIEFVFEMLDAALLLVANSDRRLWGPFKLKRPWFTIVCGLGVWFAMIGIGVSRGRNAALPVPAGWVGLTGVVEGTCKTVINGAGLRGAIIGWSDGAFKALGSSYEGGL
jgi:hypothetical protein